MNGLINIMKCKDKAGKQKVLQATFVVAKYHSPGYHVSFRKSSQPLSLITAASEVHCALSSMQTGSSSSVFEVSQPAF